jgi:hypothetical protein
MTHLANLVRSLTATGVAVVGSVKLAAASLDDIQFWAGAGAHRAALVIDWQDAQAPQSLLWGFRWDGTATGLDMLQAVVSADPRLYAHLGQFGWGTAVFGLGYDLNGNGAFAVNPPVAFDSGGLALDTNPDDARAAVDAGDHWREGWNTGFWAYYLKGSSGDAWESAMTGAADRVLSDGAWDGYSFAAGFVSAAPGEPVPAAVPEPGTLVLLVLGALALARQWTAPTRRRASHTS